MESYQLIGEQYHPYMESYQLIGEQYHPTAKTCVCMKMLRERTYYHVIDGHLSCPGSVFYLIGHFHILCTDSGSGF
jgi:hypothetical protein